MKTEEELDTFLVEQKSVEESGREKGNRASQQLESEPDGISLRMALLRVWQERRFVLKAGFAGFCLATVFAFVIPPCYESTTRLMPPDQQSGAGLALLASKVDDKLGPLAAQALNLGGSGALYVAILRSRTVEDRLISRFDMRQVYRVRLWKDARERLEDNTEVSEDRKSGIITLTVTDKSPQRAAMLAEGYAEELNKLSAELTSSAAHRERVFLEERLKTVKEGLDATSRQFSEFASRNMAIDIAAQSKAMLEAAARLQGELIAAEAQLSGLKQIYTENNVRVRTSEARIQELKRQIAAFGGSSTASESDKADPPESAPYPAIRKLPGLGVTYFDFYRQVKIQEAVYEILTKQYEMAKVQEVREVPTVRVLDKANIPEKKSSPKRLLLMVLGTFFLSFAAIAYALASDRWRSMETDHPAKLFAREISQGAAQDFQYVLQKLSRARNGTHPPVPEE